MTEQATHIQPAQLSLVALKLFFAIGDQWQLTDEQRRVLAGLGSRSGLHRWRQANEAGKALNLGRDALERLSYIAGIYKALQLLFSERQAWREWVHKPNRDFGGQSALERMLAGNVLDLAVVRQYLDAQRGSDYD